MQLSYYMNSLKPSMLSGCDLHCLDKIGPLRLTLYTIRANIFRTRKFFPVSNADALTGFLALCSDDDDDDDDQPKAMLGGLGSDMKWKATQNNSCAKVNQQLLPATIILIGFFHWIFKPIYHYIFIGCL